MLAVWKGIDKMAYGLLTGYEVKIVTTTLSCNHKYDRNIMIKKTDTVGGRNTYVTEVGTVNEKHNSLYEVSVKPVFLNDIRGKLSHTEKKVINNSMPVIVLLIILNIYSVSCRKNKSINRGGCFIQEKVDFHYPITSRFAMRR